MTHPCFYRIKDKTGEQSNLLTQEQLNMSRYLFPITFILSLLSVSLSSCSKDDKDEPMRYPDYIEGVWSPDGSVYLEFSADNVVRNLKIETRDGLSIGSWTKDVYFYEPGYNLVIYLTSEHQADVYQIVEAEDIRFVWCWVESIERGEAESAGKLIGDIINKAQEGFTLNPELYETYFRISMTRFLSVVESLDLLEPWNPWED